MSKLNRKACAIVLILILIIGLIGCTQPSSSQPSLPEVTTTAGTVPASPVTTGSEKPTDTSPSVTRQPTEPTSGITTVPTVADIYLSPEEAADVARDRVGSEARILSVEAEFDDNPPIYEIELEDGTYHYELEIHAITGAIIDYEKERFENEIDDD